jgi:hypothetical protein
MRAFRELFAHPSLRPDKDVGTVIQGHRVDACLPANLGLVLGDL